MKTLLSIFLLAFVSTGCSLVGCDRVFPKLDWYWSQDAKRCRAERRQSNAGAARTVAVRQDPASRALVSRQNASVIAPQLFHRDFVWDYPEPMPADNVAFDLEASINLSDWQRLLTTNQPPVAYDSPNATEFYRVGAHWIIPPTDF